MVSQQPRRAAQKPRGGCCVCSPNQNRKGAGVPGPHGVLFFALYWCPVHGIEKALEAVRRGEADLRPGVTWPTTEQGSPAPELGLVPAQLG
jgi:hypothetical protein